MATNKQPVLKRCKTLKISPAVMGIHKETHRNQKQNMRRKQSEYALQLQEKQKLKFIYGVLEKQFHKYFLMADKAQGITGEVLLQLLERRLDNVVFRLGYANTRREARQLIATATLPSMARRLISPPISSRPVMSSLSARRAVPRSNSPRSWKRTPSGSFPSG